MSTKTMPILFLNMGGEMVYILDQRLAAQSVKSDKSRQVLGDIIGAMFSHKFLDELFKSQELQPRRSMRSLFEKLAHSSIMRLNETSMDKLYDLMTMAIKFQLQHCVSAKDVLYVTLNHLDGIRKLVQGVAGLQAQIDYAYSLIETNYFGMTDWELVALRYTLLGFYQDARIKVSLLLREKKQLDDGHFTVPTKGARLAFGAPAPGTVRLLHKGKQTKADTFSAGGPYTQTAADGSLAKTAKRGERTIELGSNMYKNAAATDTQGGVGSTAALERSAAGEKAKDAQVKDELKLLNHLLSPAKPGSGKAEPKTDFSLSLFESAEDEEKFVELAMKTVEDEGKVVKIDASKPDKRAVEKMVGQLSLKDKKPKKAKGDELLELMDEADEPKKHSKK